MSSKFDNWGLKMTSGYVAHLRQQCHNSKFVIFQERRLKVLKFHNFLSTKMTQLLSSCWFYRVHYDIIPLKSASANFSCYTNNSKMSNFEL